jgi:hypothetical protein
VLTCKAEDAEQWCGDRDDNNNNDRIIVIRRREAAAAAVKPDIPIILLLFVFVDYSR